LARRYSAPATRRKQRPILHPLSTEFERELGRCFLSFSDAKGVAVTIDFSNEARQELLEVLRLLARSTDCEERIVIEGGIQITTLKKRTHGHEKDRGQ
jgi:hypothetical protein